MASPIDCIRAECGRAASKAAAGFVRHASKAADCGAWRVARKLTDSMLDGKGNRVYSPACIHEGLRAVRLGARGTTADELDKLIGPSIPYDDWLGLERAAEWSYKGYAAHIATSAWLDKKAKPSRAFLDACRRSGVPIKNADFSSPTAGEAISRWISEQTEGLLQPSMKPDALALACIASALYFKDAWVNGFSKALTREGPFHAEGGDREARFMVEEAKLPVLDARFGTLVGCPLSNGASMVFALPDEEATLPGILAGESVLEAIAAFDAEPADVELHLPKFTCETTLGGMEGIFAEAGFATAGAPDLRKMTGRGNTLVSFAHGAKISIDENGIEAGAYFAAIACAGMPPEDWEPPKPRMIVLDRPFLYALVSRTGQPLFIGTVALPG